MHRFRLTLDSNLNSVFQSSVFVRGVCERLGMNIDDTFSIDVCVVEAVTNVIKHAYHGAPGKDVSIEVSAKPTRLDLYVHDQGQSMPDEYVTKLLNGSQVFNFDPQDLAGVPEGGMGLQIIHQLIDEVDYSVEGGTNSLRLTKFLRPSEPHTPEHEMVTKSSRLTMNDSGQALWKLLGVLYKPHPWHGVSPGSGAPAELQCFVEVVPSDTVKYEIDKISGYLKLDRPQKYSSICPALYGFVPQTLCADRIGDLSSQRTERKLEGDGDPLDICILTDRPIHHGNLLVDCIPIGGLRMVDNNEADDKIIAVLKNDASYGSLVDIQEVQRPLLDRLRHYFISYKQSPDSETPACQITHVYGRDEAHDVILRSLADYREQFGSIEEMLSSALATAR
jgi:inorganic pyrophosphatase